MESGELRRRCGREIARCDGALTDRRLLLEIAEHVATLAGAVERLLAAVVHCSELLAVLVRRQQGDVDAGDPASTTG
jgi:hypothetical protein